MKTLLLASLILGTTVINSYRFAAAGGPAAFSDDFDRSDSDSLGANWTEAAGDADIAGNLYRLSTGSFGVITSVHNTSTGSITQYVKATLGTDPFYPWFVFRYTNSGSAYYVVQFDDATGTFDWQKFDNASDTSGDSIGTGSITAGLMSSQTFGITIEGTGTSTVVRIWRNPTNLPTTASNWDGDTTPDATISNDPASPVDSGNFVGLGGQQSSADTKTVNNFFGGGL